MVVVGAGAAGLAAALFAARAGARVALLESKARPGAKILISGGGRCNVLPSQATVDDFRTDGSRASLRNILGSWPLDEVRGFFERDLRVVLKREPTGKLFPVSDRARDVLDALLRACSEAGVELVTGFRVTAVVAEQGSFVLEAADGRQLAASRLVMATGGLSVPNTGSDGWGIEMLRALGHEVVAPRPALVPLLAPSGPWRELAGVSALARIDAVADQRVVDRFDGSFLFTHRGFSGPVVLDASGAVTDPRASVHLCVRWLGPTTGWDDELRADGAGTIGGALRRHLPRRLADLVCTLAGMDVGRRTAEIGRDERGSLVAALERWQLPVEGHEGYKKAEVTAGGVALSQVATKTLESRRVPGLYLCGELLDVVGRIGGYNFLWAWVSGRRAGAAAARSLAVR